MRHRALLRRVFPLVLAGIAALLTGCRAPDDTTPSPLWSPLPTRAPTATPVPISTLLKNMRPALLGAHPEAARPIWEEARAREPDSPLVKREGARLALALGDPETAEQRAWDAIITDPKDALAWALLGAIQQERGESALAEQAFSHAESLSPTLTVDMFPARWLAALEEEDSDRLTKLAQTYITQNPADPLTTYYRAEALLAAGHRHVALDLLLLSIQPDAPAVLWYTLGRTYLQLGAEDEAVIALEATLRAYNHGDTSLLVATEDPPYAIYKSLGTALVESGKCAEASKRIELLVTPYPDLQALLEAAANCPVPTPTVTPWLPEDWTNSP